MAHGHKFLKGQGTQANNQTSSAQCGQAGARPPSKSHQPAVRIHGAGCVGSQELELLFPIPCWVEGGLVAFPRMTCATWWLPDVKPSDFARQKAPQQMTLQCVGRIRAGVTIPTEGTGIRQSPQSQLLQIASYRAGQNLVTQLETQS